MVDSIQLAWHGPEILPCCHALTWCWWPLWGRALKVLGLSRSCYCFGPEKEEVQWKFLRLWHHFDLIICWSCTFDFIWRTFCHWFFFFLPTGWKYWRKKLSLHHYSSSMYPQSHRMCLVFYKVNEIKDKNLQNNWQTYTFDNCFYYKTVSKW